MYQCPSVVMSVCEFAQHQSPLTVSLKWDAAIINVGDSPWCFSCLEKSKCRLRKRGSVVQQDAAALFCCETPEMFGALRNFPELSISLRAE